MTIAATTGVGTTPIVDPLKEGSNQTEPIVENDYEIKNFKFLRSNLEVMQLKMNNGDQYAALDMRKEMAEIIMSMYEQNGSSISEQEALSLVDVNYESLTPEHTSVVDSLASTSNYKDSFWNGVPIVNWFIEDTTTADLLDYYNDGKMDEGRLAEKKESRKQTAGCIGGVVGGTAACGVISAIGSTAAGAALVGKCAALGSFGGPVGMAVGAGIGIFIGIILAEKAVDVDDSY